MLVCFYLIKLQILFKRDDLVIYDQIQKVTSEQQDQTVVCPQSVSYENCDRKTGLLTRVKTYYKRIGCKCKPIKEIIRGKCGKLNKILYEICLILNVNGFNGYFLLLSCQKLLHFLAHYTLFVSRCKASSC